MLWCVPYEQNVRTFFERTNVEVRVVEPADGLRLVGRQSFNAIVAEWNDEWRRVLPRLEQLTAFVHVGKTLPQSLVDFALNGGNGWAAQTPMQACERLDQALVPRRGSLRFVLSGQTELVLSDGTRPKLLDCSSHGLAFWLPAAHPLAAFSEGALLRGVSLEHHGHRVLREITLRVRSLVAAERGFRVGCQFQRESITDYSSGDRKLEDPLRSFALVARIAKVGKVTVRSEQGEYLELKHGRAEASTRRLAFEPRVELEPFEVVACSAQLDDSRYEWRSAVVQKEPFTLQIPLRIEECVRRHPVRRAPLRGGRFRFVHPLSMAPLEAKVVDFTPTGAQLALESNESFPPGLRVRDAQLIVDDAVANVTAVIRHHDAARVGLEFEFATPADATRVRLKWVLAGNPIASEGSYLTFDAIWEFCRKANLVNPDVAATFEPLVLRARATQDRLSRDDGRLFNALICREDDEVVAYLSAFRAYQHTWYVQHMAATAPGTRAAATLNRAIGEVCEQTPDAQYFQLAYYVDNPWPARVFGGFARRIGSAGAVLKARYFQRVRNDSEFARRPAPRCRLVTDEADIARVVSVVAATEPALLIHAMDLSAERLRMGELNARYASSGGLERYRDLMVCEDGARIVAVGLCEIGSVGINFRELASVTRLYSVHGLSAEDAEATMQELSSACCQHMASKGRPFTMLCGEVKVPHEALNGAPFHLAELTAKTELLRDFKRLARLSSAMVAGRRGRAPLSDLTPAPADWNG